MKKNALSDDEGVIVKSLCFDQSNDAMVILNESRQMVAVNKAFEKVTGYEKDEVLGRTMSVLRSDYFDDTFYQEIWESAIKKGSWVGDVVNRKKDGTVYQTRFSLGAIKDSEEEKTFFHGTFVQIEF